MPKAFCAIFSADVSELLNCLSTFFIKTTYNTFQVVSWIFRSLPEKLSPNFFLYFSLSRGFNKLFSKKKGKKI